MRVRTIRLDSGKVALVVLGIVIIGMLAIGVMLAARW